VKKTPHTMTACGVQEWCRIADTKDSLQFSQ
jgi:hypothetical protein